VDLLCLSLQLQGLHNLQTYLLANAMIMGVSKLRRYFLLMGISRTGRHYDMALCNKANNKWIPTRIWWGWIREARQFRLRDRSPLLRAAYTVPIDDVLPFQLESFSLLVAGPLLQLDQVMPPLKQNSR
jgi:hypothetical protein